jgi:hypothetical protein
MGGDGVDSGFNHRASRFAEGDQVDFLPSVSALLAVILSDEQLSVFDQKATSDSFMRVGNGNACLKYFYYYVSQEKY